MTIRSWHNLTPFQTYHFEDTCSTQQLIYAQINPASTRSQRIGKHHSSEANNLTLFQKLLSQAALMQSFLPGVSLYHRWFHNAGHLCSHLHDLYGNMDLPLSRVSNLTCGSDFYKENSQSALKIYHRHYLVTGRYSPQWRGNEYPEFFSMAEFNPANKVSTSVQVL
jgi:hypothetical protein